MTKAGTTAGGGTIEEKQATHSGRVRHTGRQTETPPMMPMKNSKIAWIK